MKTIKILLLASIGFALLLASASASAILIANSDFETGTLANWTTFTTANGTIGNPSVVSFDVTGSGASMAAEFFVGENNYTKNEEGGGIFKAFISGVGTLSATIDIAARMPNSKYIGNFSGGVFSVLLDSIVRDTYDFEGILVNQTLRSSLSFSTEVAPGMHELRILMTRPYTTNSFTPIQYIDNVVVNGPSAIPEPGMLMLFGIGLGVLRLGTRRAKQ